MKLSSNVERTARQITCKSYSPLLLSALSLAMSSNAVAQEVFELEPVKIMGEKMDRTDQQTITATTVLDDKEIAAKTQKSLIEVVQEVPNVTVGGFGGIANIRGADGNGGGKSSLAWRGATRARTATIVDGVSQIWTGGNALRNDLWDMEQIEILRGPQSTAQGRSAIGGAIVVKSKDPSFENEAAIRLGTQQANGKTLNQVAGVVSGPISEEVAYRLSANVMKGEHFINYIDDDPDFDYNKDPDDVEQQDIKAKVLWLPESMPELAARFDYQHQAQKGPYINQVEFGDNGKYRAPMSKVNHRIGDTTLDNFIADFDYDLGNHKSLDITASYSKFKSQYFHNQGATGSFKMDSWDQDNLSLEGRMNFMNPSSSIKGMIGASYITDDLDLDIYRPHNGAIIIDGTTENTTMSLFGEAEYGLLDKLDLIFGGRVENEKQQRVLSSTTTSSTRDKDETFLLPKLGLRYTQSDDQIFGIDVRKGYTPGGIYMDTDVAKIYSYETEYVTAMELSSKTRFWEQKGQLNINAFYNKYEDYQAPAGRLLTNIDEATTYGLEVEAKLKLSNKTDVYANASVLSTKADKFSAQTAWEGNELPFAANRTIGAGVNHAFNDAFSVGLNAKYVGEYFIDLDNDVQQSAGQNKAGDYTLVNLNAAYNLSKDTVLKAYVNNLTDENVVTYYFASSFGPSSSQDVLAPRTIGLTLDHNF